MHNTEDVSALWHALLGMHVRDLCNACHMETAFLSKDPARAATWPEKGVCPFNSATLFAALAAWLGSGSALLLLLLLVGGAW